MTSQSNQKFNLGDFGDFFEKEEVNYTLQFEYNLMVELGLSYDTLERLPFSKGIDLINERIKRNKQAHKGA